MPGRSGVELARIVRELYPHLPVLLASGYSEEIARGAASDFPILAKPYGADSLARALTRVIEDAARDVA